MRKKEIRVVASSGKLNMSEVDIAYIKAKLNEYTITFGKNVNNSTNEYNCPSLKERKDDLEEAFKDKNVDVIMIARGGFFSNQLLDVINYETIKNNPKIIVGFSDATSLLNAIYRQTGVKTYYGPNFSVLAMRKGNEYTYKYLRKIFEKEKKYNIEPSKYWSSDKWYKNQNSRKFIENKGIEVINSGEAEGVIIGGNLNSFSLLQGTKYMPNADEIILFLEEDNWAKEDYMFEFDRRLQSITQQKFFKNVKGIVFGRAQEDVNMTLSKWKYLIDMNSRLRNIPIIINADFGHTMPITTFPIGGKCLMKVSSRNNEIQIINNYNE